MVIVGGSFTAGFIEAEPVPMSDSVVIFDTESGFWRDCKPKTSQHGPTVPGPWNLVFCSLVKLDP